MHPVRIAALCVVVLGIVGTAHATSLLPLSTVADESGFGTLYDSLSSSFVGGDFDGTLDSRVYVNAIPATQVTFVFDLMITGSASGVQDFSIAATGVQNDLRIQRILNGINGYVTGTTSNDPDSADAYDNLFPASDQLYYGWGVTLLEEGDRAVLYVTTTGAVDVGQVSAAIQNGSNATGLVLAPVDDPSAPDMDVPEPATMVLLALGLGLIRRR